MIDLIPLNAFRNRQQLCVIRTDFSETETLLRRLADRAREHDPREFAGKTPCVYFKLPYVPPCESFKELRNLILRVHENTGLRANYRGIVAIEATEWLGHEREEYFSVILKYLYDHRDIWQSVMIVNNCATNRLQRFLSSCARYITPRCFDICLFSQPDTLEDMLRTGFSKLGCTVQPQAISQLTSAFLRSELKDDRSLTLIERVMEELTDKAGRSKQITERLVHTYLTKPFSTLTMLAGKPLSERNDSNEKDTVLL